MMKRRNQYLRVVEWSEEDQCFIGRVPGLTMGGVHGKNEAKVYEKLGVLIDEWIEIHEADGAPLPPATVGKKYSGRFNIRLGAALHERLAIESLKESESLNSYCVKVLKDQVGL
jgi:predicted HicB family RNase H-like nuclease